MTDNQVKELKEMRALVSILQSSADAYDLTHHYLSEIELGYQDFYTNPQNTTCLSTLLNKAHVKQLDSILNEHLWVLTNKIGDDNEQT